MEEIDNQRCIDKICTVKDKDQEETFLRELWRECFQDTKSYEDFYFTNVYKKNVVYAIKGSGMIHLNPYLCKIGDGEKELHYIVGVGTHFSQRRKGVMRQLLKQVFADMYYKEEPFTYLMPADVQYYEPFGFFSISEKKEITKERKQPDQSVQNCNHQAICYMEYEQIKSRMDMKKQQYLYEKVDHILEKKYYVFAKHGEAYFELLAREKKCQNGRVVFCFAGEPDIDCLLGFFAYSMEKAEAYVEQSVFEDYIFSEEKHAVIAGYLQNTGRIKVIERFPFMVRIINALECIMAYPQSFYTYAEEGKRIFISDQEILENDGIYSFFLKEKTFCVEKQDIDSTGRLADKKNHTWDLEMSMDELTRRIFGGLEKDRIFFAEIV